MQLKEDITFDDGKIEGSTVNPAKDGANCVLHLSVLFSQEIAKTLGKYDQFYGNKGIPFQFKGDVKLEESMTAVDIRIPPSKGMRLSPGKITTFSVHRKSDKENDVTLRLHFHLHFKGDEVLKHILALILDINNKEFRVKLDPKQGSLFEKGADKQSDDSSDAEKEGAGTVASANQMKLAEAK